VGDMTETRPSKDSVWRRLVAYGLHFIIGLVPLAIASYMLWRCSQTPTADSEVVVNYLRAMSTVLAVICGYFLVERILAVLAVREQNANLSKLAQEMVDSRGQRHGQLCIRDELPSFVSFMEDAKQVTVIAHTLCGHLGQKRNRLATAVVGGLTLNVLLPDRALLADPGVRDVHEREENFKGIEDELYETGAILMHAMAKVAEAKRKKGLGKIEVRVSGSLPYLNTTIRVDPKGRITLRCALYPHHVDFDERPVLLLEDPHDEIFQTIKSQADELWEAAKSSKLNSLQEMKEYFGNELRNAPASDKADPTAQPKA